MSWYGGHYVLLTSTGYGGKLSTIAKTHWSTKTQTRSAIGMGIEHHSPANAKVDSMERDEMIVVLLFEHKNLRTDQGRLVS